MSSPSATSFVPRFHVPFLLSISRTPAKKLTLPLSYSKNSTPWERTIEYDVPADLPACEKCICAWGWVPNHCGQENMYMTGFNCRVKSTSTKALGKPKPPVWCEDDESACQTGPKQMIYCELFAHFDRFHPVCYLSLVSIPRFSLFFY